MARYVTTADANVSLNGTWPFNSVSVPCGSGSVIPLSTGILTLRGGKNQFARYDVRLQGNVAIAEGGAVTPIAAAILLDGVVMPESVAIVTPAADGDYWHINTGTTITVPCGCCVSVSAAYVDGTEDDASVTPTPSITLRRNASIDVNRTA